MPHSDPAEPLADPVEPLADPVEPLADHLHRGTDPAALLTAPGAPFATTTGPDGRRIYADGPRTLREFAEVTWAYGERPFLVAEERTYTYGEFFAAACALARRFTEVYGLRRGDRAVVAMRNHPEWQIAFWATQLAGLVAVPLNGWWTEEEFRYALDDCRPRLLLVDGERVARVRDWAAEHAAHLLVFHAEEGHKEQRYEDLPAADPVLGPPEVDVRPEDDATIIYTSGTTGRPKGAVATHLAQAGAAANPRYHVALAALEAGTVPGLGPTPVSLTTFPFFHVAAFTSVYAVMAAGGTLVMMRKWDARHALDLVHAHGVTHYAGVPTTALQLLDAAEADPRGLGPLTLLSTGGAAAPPGIAARCTGPVQPRNGYGLTETSGGVLSHSGDDYRLHPGAVGRPTPATEVRIAAADGEPVADGEVGELWLRGQSLVRGYWEDPEATAAAFTPDGWFRTGDLATVDEGGRVAIVDRLKDMVIRGGENVYCVEVETALHGHPDVLDAAVLGVPHPRLGEEVAAVVRLREGAAADEEELRAHVAGSLAPFKVPAHIRIQQAPLPRNATGKVLKRELRAGLRDGTSSR